MNLQKALEVRTMMNSKTVRPDNQIEIISHLSQIISHLSMISSTSNLEDLLDLVVADTPSLVDGTGCSIYLRPELVRLYDGRLLDENDQTLRAEELEKDFIVLAATSRPEAASLIGKAFYTSNDGLAGWVFAHGTPLRLTDRSNTDELYAIAPDLCWVDRYADSRFYYAEDDRKPILIVPLMARTGTPCVGIIEFPATLTKRPFIKTSEDVAVIVAQIIANTLEKTWFIQEQDRHIRQLVELGAKQTAQELFEAVTERLGKLLRTRMCQLYLRDNGGSVVRLVAAGSRTVAADAERGVIYPRGYDSIGWIFKTGKPLLIANIRDYAHGRRLTDADLEQMSDGPLIDDDDRYLECERSRPAGAGDRPIPFLAVPVKAGDGSTLGVLCVDDPNDTNHRRAQPFSRDDLHLAESFASTIALAIGNERERRLGNLLTQLGYYWDPEELFDLVIQQLPGLVSGTGCSIYVWEHADGARLWLAASSREGLVNRGEVAEMTYDIGEGKTGFCALARATLVVNHYGAGKAAQRALSAERARIQSDHPSDLIEGLSDEHGQLVGLIQLRNGAQVSSQAQRKFDNLSKRLIVRHGMGLPSPKMVEYVRLGSRLSWSFVAVPIKTEAGDLYGVISIGRPVQKIPFSAQDVTLLESIAGRLAAVLRSLQMQEQHKRLMMTLAHELNTPLQGILADTENLMYELPPESEQIELVGHNLGQVQRLHLLTETIMTMFSEQTPVRTFSIHSIYRPLKDACRMFEGEAVAKGCDILEPQSIDSRFPDVEMSLFDLTLAFKNLIHNAIKYSFHPPRGQEKNRYVRIVGGWTDDEHAHYSIGIQNYGVGVLQKEISDRSIFEPYYRGAKASDRRRTGAGLGLAHARRVIEDLHHGSIRVTSKPMFGDAHLTTFIVTLPVRQPRSTRPAS